MSNIIAIVGRPNVGKSTLFNRLTESRNAIVEEMSGVTRDRIYGKGEWTDYEYSVIDTGGYVRGSDDVFEAEINKQVEIALEEATVIVFVVDVTTGITDLDERVAQLLRQTNKKVFVAANKVDSAKSVGLSSEFWALGVGDVYDIAAASGSGTGELLDDIVKEFKTKTIESDSDLPRFTIVGKPNVGKSSLVNALVGKERNIVTPISGTTRDAVNTKYSAFGFEFILIDTAGIRKRSKVHEDIEYYSVLRSVRTIESADVCIFMIDATEGIQKQDLNIYYMCEKNHKGVVVLVNKWDLVEDKGAQSTKEAEDHIREQLAPFNNVPIVFTSALTKQRIHKALEVAMKVYNNRIKKIQTSVLNEVMQKEIAHFPPPSLKGKYVNIKYITQLPTHAPAFAFYSNLPQYIPDSYKRFLENKIRMHFDFEGVPVRIFVRKK